MNVCREFNPHEVTETLEPQIDYAHLDALAAVPGLVPGFRKVYLDALAGEVAVRRLGRYDFPHPDDPRLFRERPQQGHRHVGFYVVLAHVAGVAAEVFQELYRLVHVPRQVNGHLHRFCSVYRGVRGGVLRRGFSRLNPGGHLVEHRAQVGVLQFRLFRNSELVFLTVGGSAGRVYRQGY